MNVLAGFLAAASGMADSQVAKESGGRQFDDDGKPLVGRYRDGSMPAPSKRAYGVAQMQVGTAEAAAKRAGIAWDEQRFMTDKAYNQSLGDSHMDYLRRKYGGDEQKAQGAYHSGEGTVDRLIREKGSGWAAGLGPHGRAYVAGVGGGGAGGGTQVSGLSIPEVLREKGRADGSGNIASQVYNPEQAGTQLSQDFQETRDRGTAADNVLTSAIKELGQVQQDETESLARRNESMNNVLTEQSERTQQVMARVQPLFQQRRAVVEQRRRLDAMNPLERGIRSLFDPNYDRSHLAQVASGIDEELALNGEEYKTVLGLQDRLLQIVDQSYQGLTMENQLRKEHLNQDVELAAKSFSLANELWSTDLRGLDTDRALRGAQLELRNQVLSTLTPAQIDTYHEQAKKSADGTVMVNGANLSEGQLLQARQNFAEQDVRLQQMDLAAQAQNAALKDKAEDDLIGSMNTQQVQQALNQGGQYQGRVLSLEKLGARLQSSKATDAQMIESQLVQGGTQTFNDMRRSIGKTTEITGKRAMALTGGLPQPLMQVMQAQNPEVTQMMQKIASAPPEQRDRLAQQYLPRLQQMAQERQQAVDKIAESWAGTNKDAKPLAMAFLTGTPLNGESAARGIISLIRGGTGASLANASPEAKAAFDAAKATMAAFEREQRGGAGQAIMGGQRMNAKEKEAELIRRVGGAMSEAYTNSQFNSILLQAPQVAKQIGHLGQNLDSPTVSQAIAAGDEEGYRRIGVSLGISPQEAQTMFRQGEQGPIWQRVKDKADGAALGDLAGTLSLQQSMATAQYLDQNHPKIGRFTAGQVYTNLLANPKFANYVGQMAMGQGQQGFADFAVSSVGGSGLTGQVAQYGAIAQQAYERLNTSRGMRAALKANEYNADPQRRMAAILGAMPDLPPEGEKALMRVLGPIAANQGAKPGTGTFVAGVEIPQAPNDATFGLMRQAIMTQKFQDPVLEKYRQQAAKAFDQYAQVTDAAFDRFGTYAPE